MVGTRPDEANLGGLNAAAETVAFQKRERCTERCDVSVRLFAEVHSGLLRWRSEADRGFESESSRM